MLNRIRGLSARVQRRLGVGMHAKIEKLKLLAGKSDWKALDENCQRILKRNQNAEVSALQAYSFQQQGDFEKALKHAEDSLALQPGQWLPNLTAGICLVSQNQFEKARFHFREANHIAPWDKQTIRKLTEVSAKIDGVDSAAALYRVLLSKVKTGPAEPGSNVACAPLDSVPSWCLRNGLPLIDAGEVEQIPFKTPRVLGSAAEPKITFAASNKPYVAELRGARVFGKSSVILMPDGRALHDDGAHPDFGPIVSFAYERIVIAQEPGKLLLDFSGMRERSIPEGILMTGLASASFGHWIPEFLPKLQFLMKHPDFARLPLLLDADMPPSHFEHLARLVSNPHILIQADESVVCQRLLVAPSPAFLPTETLPHNIPVEVLPGLSPRAMIFVKGSEHPQDDPHLRLFLARKNMKWRRLLNEAELLEDLQPIGFQPVYFEEKTAAEQIELFQRAEFIVAPNGSALLNVIFAGPKTKVVVLTQPNLFNWGTFQGPIDALGYESICVSGDYARSEGQKHSDYTVSAKKIRAALAELGLKF